MLNAIIKSGRFRICILFVNSIIILTYIIVYCGCSTTEVLTESPDVQKPGFTRDIKSIELLNGNEIDCEDKLMKIEKDTGSAGIVIVQTADSIKAGSAGFSFKTDWNELRIPFKNIRNFQLYDTTETDFLSGTVILLGAAFVGIIIAGAVILSK